jgi:elongation factor G
MDRERADPEGTLQQIRDVLGANPVPLQVPIGKEDDYRGYVDLLRRQAFLFAGDNSGKVTKGEISADLTDAVEAGREALVEAAAEGDDALIEKYLETMELTDEEVFLGLEKGIRSGAIVPVLFGAARDNKGVGRLLDVTAALPSILDRPARKDTEGADIEAKPGGDFVGLVVKSVIDAYAGKISIVRVLRGEMKPDLEVINTTRDSKERIGQVNWILGKKLSPANHGEVGDIIAVAKLKDTQTGDTLASSSARVQVDYGELAPSMATYIVRPASKADEDKMRTGILKLIEEDPALHLGNDDLTKEMTLSGSGNVHVETNVARLKRKYGVEVTLEVPPVPYRETVRGQADVEGKHKKQTGGRGQFGVAWLRLEPTTRGEGFEFVNSIVGGAIPRQYIPAVEKGIVDAMSRGVLAGYPVTDVRVTCYDGKHHPVDSSENAFKMAGSKGFKAGFMKCQPVLLEPIMEMTITVPEDKVGDVMGDISGRRGRVLNTEYGGRKAVVSAQVPLAEARTYGADLRSMTQGKGSFVWQLSGYEELPSNLQDKVVAASTRKLDDEEE